MDNSVVEKAINMEADRLGRLHPTELMSLVTHDKEIVIDGISVHLKILVQDYSETRHIGVLATKKIGLGLYKKFSQGYIVELSSRRLTDYEVASLYD
jgi:hypothetical protein